MEFLLAAVVVYVVIDHFYLRKQYRNEYFINDLQRRVLLLALLRKNVINDEDYTRAVNEIAGETYEGDWKKYQKAFKARGTTLPSYMHGEELENFIAEQNEKIKERDAKKRIRELELESYDQ